jgi:hypothetical protein
LLQKLLLPKIKENHVTSIQTHKHEHKSNGNQGFYLSFSDPATLAVNRFLFVPSFLPHVILAVQFRIHHRYLRIQLDCCDLLSNPHTVLVHMLRILP